MQNRGAGPERTTPAGSPASAAARWFEGGAAHRARKLGRAARLFFSEQFFLLPKLVDTVREFLSAGGARHLVDLYCGVGFFGIELAGAVESFLGVEYDQRAIKSARRNAAARQISNGEFMARAVEEVLPELWERFPPSMTTVLLDPPRKGCLPRTLQLLRETAGTGHLRLVPSGDHGAGLEHFVRGGCL
jgi:tRNA/tmRNA/rRNA uracil-C5-methylase (TrmA/RlmC/RlmD family)